MEPTQWVQIGTIVVSFVLFLIPIRFRRTIIEKEASIRLWPWIIAKLPGFVGIEAKSKNKFVLKNRASELTAKETEKGFVLAGKNIIGDLRLTEGLSVKITIRGDERPALVLMRLDPTIERILYAGSLAMFLQAVIRLFT